MFDKKHKYIRLGEYDHFIFFPTMIDHSIFKHLNPVSAGFCYLDSESREVQCFGKSVSLWISGKSDDTALATKQVYGETESTI